MARRKKKEHIPTEAMKAAMFFIEHQDAVLRALKARADVPPFSVVAEPRAKKKPENGFVAWMRDTAEERRARRDLNRKMAKAIRAGTASDAQVAAFVRAKKGDTAESWRALARMNGYRV